MKRLNTFYDESTHTLTYIIWDEDTQEAIVIDPVWDIDLAAGKLDEIHHQKIKSFLSENYLDPILTLETHAHADHLSGAMLMKRDYSQTKIGIGKNIVEVQQLFAPIFNMKDFNTSGVQFDLLFDDNQVFEIGSFSIQVMFTPGHTPACASYLIDGHLFTGDALFMPDGGTGRCDFPRGSARDLYRSVKRLYQLPDETLVHPGHDYQPGGRELKYSATLAEHKKSNIQLKETTTEEEFVKFRESRDKTLSAPKLLYPSLQVNISAGQLPHSEDNDKSYLKIPLNK